MTTSVAIESTESTESIESTEATTNTETTNMAEAPRPDAESATESQRLVAQAHPGSETGTSFLPSATPGAIIINWK
jgi:hypothetical protein